MKILKIEFQNINSLKGRHEIDFTKAPFTVSSLFAITGPTGSGKSTLLDVICLALFNQVPRLGKISKNEIINKGAILTRNQKEATATVTFESKNGTFASFWSISTARTGNLRDYEMQLFDLATGKALDLKKSDVPSKNEELIGLSYEQFVKSVLLAQGEFAQFLRAKKDERGELLEKITGTGIYRQLGIKAFQKKKEVSSEIEKEQQEIELHQKNLLQEEQYQSLSEELKEKTENCKPIEKVIKELEKNLQLKKDIQELNSRIARNSAQKESAATALQEFEDSLGLSLSKHEKVQLFGEELRTWRQLRANIGELQKEQEEICQRLKTNYVGIHHCLEEIQTFLKRDAAAENIENELQNFSAGVRQLQKQREGKLHTYSNIETKIKAELREVPFQLNGDLETSEAKLTELQANISAELEKLKPALSEINLEKPAEEKQRLKEDLDRARHAEQKAAKLKNIKLELDRLQQERTALKPQLEELPRKIELGEAKALVLKERLEKLLVKKENENLRKSLEDHRHHLQDGKPCPLCGALEHPYAKDLPKQEDGLQEQLAATEKELAVQTRENTSQQTSLNHYREREEKLLETEKQTERELVSQKGHFEQEFGVLASDNEESHWNDLVKKYDRQINGLERYEKENQQLKAISVGLPLIKDLKKVLSEGKEIKEKLDELYSGENIEDDCRKLQNKWTALQHQKNTLQARTAELEKKITSRSQEIRHLEEQLSPRVEKEGCKDISEALQRLLPEEQAATLRKKKENLCQEAARIDAALKTLKEQLENLVKRDMEKTSEALQEELKEKQENLAQWNRQCEELRRQLQNHEDTRKRIEQIEGRLAERKQKIRRWELLNQLIGDSTGKKFNDFAQDLSLSQLLQLANVRLRDLSDRYIIDKPGDEEDDSLVAIDEHMGGQRRSVKTLSGGETFILSLSMALALSDLASKNVEINSLFIDEGFGTLDPETLDQTLDTLERLQAESSKTIGIISHVDSLKERIATQIKLTRNGQGYSSLEITG